MKITRITLWEVALTSHLAYHMAAGKTCDVVPSILLRVDTDGGVSGWGEVCPIPHYLPAYAGGVRAPATIAPSRHAQACCPAPNVLRELASRVPRPAPVICSRHSSVTT